jgi:L-methionine (R)-S-oxide reductase
MIVAHEELLSEFREFAKTAPTAKSVMELIARRLHEKMTRFNWVGFYQIDPADDGVLVIGTYVGSFTPNERIPLNSGLCGAAARTSASVVVDDVAKDPRYLAGSSLVRSEIVVPIFVKTRLAAVMDAESYFTGAFGPAEKEFVEACAGILGKYLERK